MSLGYEPQPTVPPPTHPPPGWVPSAPESHQAAPAAGSADERRKLRVEVVVVAIAFTLPPLLQAFRGITDPTSISTDISVVDLLTTVAGQLAPGLIVGFLLWRDGHLRTAGFGRRSPWSVIGYGLLGFVCCWVAIFTVAVGITAVRGLPDKADDNTEDSLHRDASVPLTFGSLAAAASISIAAGVAEETVFRAYATTRLEQAGLAKTAIWAPWALFTTLHLYEGPLALLLIGSLAAVLTWLYRWRRSVYPGVIAHALYDFSSFLLFAFATNGILR